MVSSGEGSARPQNRLEVIRVPDWSGPEWDWLVHGFSTRSGGMSKVYRPESKGRNGDLNLGFTASDKQEIVMTNRQRFLRAVRGRGGKLELVTLAQFHSSLIRDIQPREIQSTDIRSPAIQPGPPSKRTALAPSKKARLESSLGAAAVWKGDGWMTRVPGILLGIQTADCLPILMADRRNHVVAAFHAGWRGTLQRIVEKGVGRMRLQFGSKPEDLVAAIGPGIGPCCYAVGEEIEQQFHSQFAYAAELFREVSDSDAIRRKYPMLFLTARAPGHSNLGPQIHLDLAEANRRQLLAAGLPPGAVHLARECTACQTERFFSHRAEHGFTGRMMSVIGIRP